MTVSKLYVNYSFIENRRKSYEIIITQYTFSWERKVNVVQTSNKRGKSPVNSYLLSERDMACVQVWLL